MNRYGKRTPSERFGSDFAVNFFTLLASLEFIDRVGGPP